MSAKRKIPVSVAIRKIRTHKPTSPKAFKAIGLTLRWIESGVFRETCRIINCDLVVKFPLIEKKTAVEGRRHTRTEIARIGRLAKHRWMRPYLPTIYWHDKQSGTLVMSYHPPFTDHEDQVDALGKFVQLLLRKSTGVRSTDLHSENIHKKRENWNIVTLIDLGY